MLVVLLATLIVQQRATRQYRQVLEQVLARGDEGLRNARDSQGRIDSRSAETRERLDRSRELAAEAMDLRKQLLDEQKRQTAVLEQILAELRNRKT